MLWGFSKVVFISSFNIADFAKIFFVSSDVREVTTAVSEDELNPIEGTRVMGLIDSYRRTLELTEIEKRLQALENAH